MPLNLSFQPPILEIIARPGATITQAYSVTNHDQYQVSLRPEVLPFAPKGNDGSVTYENQLQNPNIQFSLQNTDLALDVPFILKPGETKQLVLKIKTLSNIPQTDSYYTLFLSQTDSANLSGTSGSTALGRIGSHVLIANSSTQELDISASVTHLKVSPSLRDIFLTPLNFTAQVNNLSDHYFKTDGKLTVYKNGTVIKEFTLQPLNVLQNHSRDIQCADSDLKPVECSLKPPFWPGAYTVSLESNSASASTTFFVLPYSLLAFLLFIGLIYFFAKRSFSSLHTSAPPV